MSGLHLRCGYPECTQRLAHREYRYYQSGYGYVCTTHDKVLGRAALVAEGWPENMAVYWETNPDRAEGLLKHGVTLSAWQHRRVKPVQWYRREES